MLKEYSGVGCVYMANVDADGVKTGEFRRVGNAYPLSVQVETEQIESKSRMCDTAGQTLATKTEISGTKGSLTLRQWNAANLAAALSGTATALTASGGTVADEAVTALDAGEYAELAHPVVSSVVVQDVTDATTYVDGTDFLINERLGLITIIDGGGISAGDVLHIDYTYAAESGYQVDIGTQTLFRVAIKASLKNEFTAEEFSLELDSVVLASNAEINFISEAGTEGEELPFSMSLETVGSNTSPGRVNGVTM